MRHFFPLIACLLLAPAGGFAGNITKTEQAVAVIDFDYLDTSGEPRDQRAEHEARLAAFMSDFRTDLAKGGDFRVVAPKCGADPCSSKSQVEPLLVAARDSGADILLLGGVHKMSTLVQWAQVEAIEAGSGRVLFNKLFTFRGDTDEAWRRAENFMIEEMHALPPS
jgi:hypothetical protein